MVILSSPYSSKDKNVVAQRVKETGEYVVSLMEQGITVVSPTLYGLGVIEYSEKKLPDSYEFWEKYCRDIVKNSDEMYVAAIEGWEDSKGVNGEIEYAKEFGKNIWLVEKIDNKVVKTKLLYSANNDAS